MSKFVIKIRSTNNTKVQHTKNDAINKLVSTIGERLAPSNPQFKETMDAMAEWFSPTKGKIKNVTQHWDESKYPQSGTNLIISTRAVTMDNLLLINRYLKKGMGNGSSKDIQVEIRSTEKT